MSLPASAATSQHRSVCNFGTLACCEEDVNNVKIDTSKHCAPLICIMAMQALRCLLRSRQEIGGRSVSAALHQTVTYKFAALQVPARLSSQILITCTPGSVHSHVSSSTMLPKHLYGFALSNSQGSGHPHAGGACVGKLPSFPPASTPYVQRALLPLPEL